MKMRVDFSKVVNELNEVADMYAAGKIDKAEAMMKQCDILDRYGFVRAATHFIITAMVEFVYDADYLVIMISKGNKGMKCENIRKFRWEVVSNGR